MIKVNVCVPVIGILCFITIETIEAAKCLQDAQRLCQKESAGLIDAGRTKSGVCSAYADYEDCIRTSIGKLGCRLLPSEAELHETDITNVYTKYPYQCTKTQNGKVSITIKVYTKYPFRYTKTQNGWIAALTARSSAPGLLFNPFPWFLLAISSWL